MVPDSHLKAAEAMGTAPLDAEPGRAPRRRARRPSGRTGFGPSPSGPVEHDDRLEVMGVGEHVQGARMYV